MKTRTKVTNRKIEDVVRFMVVKGWTWGRFEAIYRYPIKGEMPTTYQECKALAGDFESLSSIEVIEEKTEGLITTKTYKVGVK